MKNVARNTVAYSLKKELWSQRNNRCNGTAPEQHSFLGNGRETDN
jgi:hypothetical protein